MNEINQPGFYVPTRKNFALVDAILVLPNRVVGVKVIADENHPFASSGVADLKEKFGSFDLVYVVPERIFDSFVVKTGLENLIADPGDSVFPPSTSPSQGIAQEKRLSSASTQITEKKLKIDSSLLENIKIYVLKMPRNFSNEASI